MKRVTTFLLLVLFISAANIFAQKTVIKNAALIDPVQETTLENAMVIIDGSEIIYAGEPDENSITNDMEVIDASGKYLIPGLADGHIHFFQSGGLYTRPDGLDLRHRVPYEDQELSWIKNNIDDFFRRYLRCGVTTVVDVGGPYWNFEVRAQARATAAAPNVYLSGPLIASYQPPELTTDDPPIIKVTSKEEALDLVHKQYQAGTDFIKVWYVVSKNTSTGLDEFYPIYEAIVEESHRLGLKVYVHATELETARKAVEGGADVLVHQVTDKKVDKDLLNKMKKNGVMLMPTLWVFSSYSAVYSKNLDLMEVEHQLGNPYVIGTLYDMYELDDDELGERHKKLQAMEDPAKPNQTALENTNIMQDAGITIVTGTDAGNVGVIHGPGIFHEFEFMKMAGMTPMQILKASTINAAEMLDRDDFFGSIEKGKIADLVVLNSNPLDDIHNTQDIDLVVKSGMIFEPENIINIYPEDLAQIQLNAYNERDLEAFLSVYSDDVEIYQFPDKLMYTGKEQMRKNYKDYFAKSPELHCRLLNRIAEGSVVIDKEHVTGARGDEELRATAMYEIKDGKIQKVWFVKGE